MKPNLILIILLPVVFAACKESPIGINVFDEVVEITGYDSIYSDKDDAWGAIADIDIYNGMLVTKHTRDEYSFSFIDVADRKLLKRWGKRGEGPGEFLDFGSSFEIQDSLLIFDERMKKSINYVSITDILGDSSAIDVVTEPYPYTVDFRPMRFCFLDTQKIAVGSFKKGRFGVLDSNDSIVDCSSNYPFSYDKIEGILMGSVFQSDVESSKMQRKFVISTFASDVFEIYQVSDNGIHRIFVSPYRNVPQIWKKGERYTVDYDKSIAGLMKIAVSDSLICFTYSSLSYTEAAAMDMESREVLCFNWKGEKVKKYILPFPISNFCIDEQSIYGIRYLDDKTVIYRFDLSL